MESRVSAIGVGIPGLNEVCEEGDEVAARLLVFPGLQPRHGNPAVLGEEKEDLIAMTGPVVLSQRVPAN